MAKHKKHKEEQTTEVPAEASGDGHGPVGWSASEDEDEAVRAGDATAAW